MKALRRAVPLLLLAVVAAGARYLTAPPSPLSYQGIHVGSSRAELAVRGWRLSDGELRSPNGVAHCCVDDRSDRVNVLFAPDGALTGGHRLFTPNTDREAIRRIGWRAVQDQFFVTPSGKCVEPLGLEPHVTIGVGSPELFDLTRVQSRAGITR